MSGDTRRATVPYDRALFSPSSRGGAGLCAHCGAAPVRMINRPTHRLAFCQRHGDMYDARAGTERDGRRLACPGCGAPARAGEACPGCGLGLPYDAKDAQRLASDQHPGARGGRPDGEWSGSSDNAARVQEGR